MIFQENNIKRIAKVDKFLVDVILAELHFRDLSNVAKIRYWQRKRMKGDDLLNDTP
jgi:hypothetical protein